MAIANWTLDQVFDQMHAGTRWDSDTITYAFPSYSGGIYSQGEATGFRATNASQQNLMLLALAAWDDLVPQAFAAGAVGSTDLEFGYTNTNIGYAHAYYPAIGSIYFNANHPELVNTYVGDYGFYTYLHEIGHSIGLRHMGDYNGNGNWSPSSFQDSIVLSVMSYFGPRYAANSYSAEIMLADWTDAGGHVWSPQTPMVNDAMAIQAIYGSSATTRLDNTVYGFGSTVGGSLAQLYDFARNLNPILTIFDSGGVDTLDLSGWGTASRIDLRPGAYSSANSMTNNIAIAYTALIENVVGGGADDALAGNDAGNWIEGRGGNDELAGGAGDDVLDGGAGVDSMRGGAGDDTYVVDHGQDVVVELEGEGVDTVILTGAEHRLGAGFEHLVMDGPVATRGYGNALDNRIVGNGADNILDGGAGADTIAGGGGSDWLVGGEGADVFVFGPGSASDEIVDFQIGVDVLDLSEFARDGQSPVLTYDGADTLLSFSDGSVITLQKVHVTLNELGMI